MVLLANKTKLILSFQRLKIKPYSLLANTTMWYNLIRKPYQKQKGLFFILFF